MDIFNELFLYDDDHIYDMELKIDVPIWRD